jgi:hypothetical protein
MIELQAIIRMLTSRISACAFVLIGLLALPMNGIAENKISMESLLYELTDLTALAEMPSPGYKCLQASSYDRKSASSHVMDDTGWFANADSGQFTRIGEKNGEKEHVLLDVEGPGAVVRIWSAAPAGAGDFKIFLDGAEAPVMSGNFEQFLGGEFDYNPEPMAGARAMGFNSYLPIPFSKHCKIVTTQPGFYYHVNYRLYEAGAEVQTLTPKLLTSAIPAIKAAAERMASPAAQKVPDASTSVDTKKQLRDGKSLKLELTDKSRSGMAVNKLTCRVEAENLETALRGALLEITFDGQATPSVRVPLGDFFGSGVGLNRFESLPLGVLSDGTMYCHYLMPFERKAQFKITNLSGASLDVSLHATAIPRPWSNDSMYFNAQWRTERDIKTRPWQDWSVLNVEGKGRYVGCVYHVANPVINWWGEGDEKIYLDGESFPSTFGTGTEDYFGYAWCWFEPFTHALHNQTRIDGPGNRGHSCVSRFHMLDSYPFESAFKFDMEVWHHVDTLIDLSIASYWYGAPDSISNMQDFDRKDMVVRQFVPMPRKEILGESGIEGEAVDVVSTSGGYISRNFKEGMAFDRPGNPTMGFFNALMTEWMSGGRSGGYSLCWHKASMGDKLTIKMPCKKAGRYRLLVGATKGPASARMAVSVDDQTCPTPVDLRQKDVAYAPEVDLGTFDFKTGDNEVSFKTLPMTNGEPNPFNFLSLDYLRLVPLQ